MMDASSSDLFYSKINENEKGIHLHIVAANNMENNHYTEVY